MGKSDEDRCLEYLYAAGLSIRVAVLHVVIPFLINMPAFFFEPVQILLGCSGGAPRECSPTCLQVPYILIRIWAVVAIAPKLENAHLVAARRHSRVSALVTSSRLFPAPF